MKCDCFLTSSLLIWRKMKNSSMHLMKKNSYTIHNIFAEVVFFCLSMVSSNLIAKSLVSLKIC